MAMDGEIKAENFGLGGELDNDAAQASDGEKAGGFDGAGTGANSIGGRLSKTDFSKLKMILDVPLKVSVELGRTKMAINDLLQLGQGSVIELDKIAGEPMEILVNDKLVAMGEVVVVNEKFGVRLTDVASQFGLSDFGPDKEAI
ncbi:MAG: flagellar motor switch protein FliN [bacterium]|jgi:flagellar motor switch protein FliN